jgi:VanZ family protein
LRQSHLLGLVVTLVFFATIVGLVYHVVFNVRLSYRIAFAALVVLASAIGAMVLGLSIPEERVHFIEYGALALLARHALSRHLKRARLYLGAWLLASLAGWVDELIQGLLPDRVHDLRDVVINSVAALLALAGDEALHNQLGWRSQEEHGTDEASSDRRG